MVGTVETKAAALEFVRAAASAPSAHNTQPWCFEVEAGRIDLWADRTRALPVNDPCDRELTISCGAALFNLRVAIARAGSLPEVVCFPDPREPDLLARVTWVPSAIESPDAELYDAVATRRTYRRKFTSDEVRHGVVRALALAAEREGAWLRVVETVSKRHAVSALVAKGDELQWIDPSWRRELALWMHPRRRGDGLSLPDVAVPVAQLVVRTFDIGHGVGVHDRDLADAAPVLVVLGTLGDEASDWLAAGQALERLLLTGVRHGLQASYLNSPVQVDSLRAKLSHLVDHKGFPQLVLRLGVPSAEVPPTPRRPLEDLLLEPRALA